MFLLGAVQVHAWAEDTAGAGFVNMDDGLDTAVRPGVSIITICKDDLVGLRRTLESTSHLDRLHVEQIVVDGGSQDGTVEFLQDSAMRVSRWVSEKDSGIAEAFNKGIGLSSREYLLFLNSGDVLIDSALERLCDFITNHRPEVVLGAVLHVDSQGHHVGRLACRRPWIWQKVRNYWPHQGMLIRRDIFSLVGPYDLKFSRAGMDYEWSLRYLRKRGGAGIATTGTDVAKMLVDGISMADFPRTFRAYHRARMDNHALPRWLSWVLSEFFIFKRRVGQAVRSTIVRKRRRPSN